MTIQQQNSQWHNRQQQDRQLREPFYWRRYVSIFLCHNFDFCHLFHHLTTSDLSPPSHAHEWWFVEALWVIFSPPPSPANWVLR
jgi:hypothetical protein